MNSTLVKNFFSARILRRKQTGIIALGASGTGEETPEGDFTTGLNPWPGPTLELACIFRRHLVQRAPHLMHKCTTAPRLAGSRLPEYRAERSPAIRSPPCPLEQHRPRRHKIERRRARHSTHYRFLHLCGLSAFARFLPGLPLRSSRQTVHD